MIQKARHKLLACPDCGRVGCVGLDGPEAPPPPVRYVDPAAVEALFRLRRDDTLNWRTIGVGLALVTFMDKEGRSFPRRKAIAQRARLSPRVVTAELASLVRVGFLKIEGRPGRSNLYQISSINNAVQPIPEEEPGPIRARPNTSQEARPNKSQGVWPNTSHHKEVFKEPEKEHMEGEGNVNAEKASAQNPKAPPLHDSLLEIIEDFKRLSKWVGDDAPIRKHLGGILAAFSEDELRAAVAKSEPGDKPWTVTDRMRDRVTAKRKLRLAP